MKRIAILACLLLLSVTAIAQQNCAYTFTDGTKWQFRFCVTPYGTLGMIQSPVGNDLLDPNNPVEGFGMVIVTGGGGTSWITNVPGLGDYMGLPDVVTTGPNNTLPLIMKWNNPSDWAGASVVEEVSANMSTHTITIVMKYTECTWECPQNGSIARVLQPAMSNFANSSQGFAWGNGPILTINGGGCAAPGAIQWDFYTGDYACGPRVGNLPYFTGPGALYSQSYPFSSNRSHVTFSFTFSYTVVSL